MNILITGGNGYIDKSLSKNLDNSISITRKDFDLTDRHATNKWFEGKYFDVVIHTAIKGGSRLLVDGGNIFYENIQMFYNLLNNKHCFSRFINFGSGAELGTPNNPYGLSKNIISRIIDNEPLFYNIRIYGVFDENELDTRFIKNNIKNYINKKPIEIHQNKLMDFFYMKDLIKLVKYYINVNHNYLPKHIDCSYSYHHSLDGIADIINNLSKHKVEIKTKTPGHSRYIGKYTPIISDYIGLEQGIKETYKKIKNGKNQFLYSIS